MPLTPPTMTIDGTPVDFGAARVQLHAVNFGLDETDTATFSQVAVGMGGASFRRGALVEVDVPTDDGALDGGLPAAVKFRGEVVARTRQPSKAGYVIGYQAKGMKFVVDRTIYVTNPGSPPGEYTFNRRPNDDALYSPSLAGKTVGQMVKILLDAHAGALASAPISIAGYVQADLDAMTVVPPEPVTFSGPLLTAIDGVLDDWCGIYCCVVRYDFSTSDWRIRFLDATTLPRTTMTLGVDPVDLPTIEEDAGTASGRTLARGLGDIRAAWVSLAGGSLIECFPDPDGSTTGIPNPTGNATYNGNAKLAWNESEFTSPRGGTDTGVVVSVTGNTATVTSGDGALALAANYWPQLQGWIYVENPAESGDQTSTVDPFQGFPITASTALTAGGNYTITWDSSLVIDSTSFTRYRIEARAAGGLSECWRRYGIANPVIANGLVLGSTREIAVSTADLVFNASSPVAVVYDGLRGTPIPGIQIDLVNKQILFPIPVVNVYGSHDNLAAGGASTDGIPTDIRVLVFYSSGPLEIACPADTVGYGGIHAPNYDGTFFATDGVSRTEIVDYGDAFDWTGDVASMGQLACVHHAANRDVIIRMSLAYHGKPPGLLVTGQAVDLAADYGSPYVTGLESAGLPVRTVEIRWPDSGPDAVLTILYLDNTRRRATGDGLYLPSHPAVDLANRLGREGTVFTSAGGIGETSTENYARMAGAPTSGDVAASGPTAEGVADRVRAMTGTGPASRDDQSTPEG